MTEKRYLPEQIASHTYKKQANRGAAARPIARQAVRKEAGRDKGQLVQRSLGRVVTIPDDDPSTAWNAFAQRQQQRRARARPVYEEVVPVAARTYAQTGMRASNGRLKALRRLPTYGNTPVPTRSGQRRSRSGFLWKLLSLLFGIITLIFVANLMLTGSAFRIKQVNVVGTHNEVLVHTIQQMGIQGKNIFLMNVMTLEGRIKASPFVASASIDKQWPDEVIVNVVERTPMLLWKTGQGTYSVDNQGMVIASVSETTGANHLKTVIDTNNQVKATVSSGKTVSQVEGIHPGVRLNQTDIMFAVNVFNRLPQLTGISDFTLRYSGTIYANTQAQSGRLDSKGSYIVESPDGWIAYLGTSDDTNPLDNRLVELQQILTLVQKQQFSLATIDLRYGLRPVYTLKQ